MVPAISWHYTFVSFDSHTLRRTYGIPIMWEMKKFTIIQKRRREHNDVVFSKLNFLAADAYDKIAEKKNWLFQSEYLITVI